MKKFSKFAFLLASVFALAACGGAKTIQLGTSDFSIVLPEGYASVADDFAEDQVAYFYKDDNSVDFDVYQWVKDSEYTLEEEAQHYASQYDTTAEKIEINGIVGMKYVSQETYEEHEYTVVNYMFEDEDSIIELCFWTVGDEEEYAAISEIIKTIKKK